MKMEGKVYGDFDLPGFRFHPTEEELVGFYLRKKVEGQQFSFDIIGTLDLYRYDPWQLPDLANIGGEREWFFFVPRDKKWTAPGRSRLTVSGYWKATGSDRPVRNRMLEYIGLKKTLVFYRGKAPKGEKTDWIMNEYRMPESCPSIKKDVVLCRIYRKATTQKTLEQRAMGEREEPLNVSAQEKPAPQSQDSLLNYQHDHELTSCESESIDEELRRVIKCEDEDMLDCMDAFMNSKLKPGELEVPMMQCVDKLISPWTPSNLLSTPKEYISDGPCIPLNIISPCKLEMPLSFL